MRRDREWRLFLDLCAPLSHEISDLPESDEWPRMLGRLEQTRFEALAYYNLRARGLMDAVPERVMAHLRAANAQALARYHLVGEMVSPHLEALAREVEFLVLKGTAWAHTVYPEPHLRQSGDIDLLVREEEQERARQVLEGRGFDRRLDPIGPEHGPTYRLVCRGGAAVYLELHPGISRASRYPHLRRDAAECEIRQQRVWGIEVRVLSPELSVAHALFELAVDYPGGAYARYLVDLEHLSRSDFADQALVEAIVRTSGVLGLHAAAMMMVGRGAGSRHWPRMVHTGLWAFRVGVSTPFERSGRIRGGLATLMSLALWDHWRDRRSYLVGYLRLLPRRVWLLVTRYSGPRNARL